MRTWQFFLVSLAVALAVFFAARLYQNDYLFFAGYVVLQFIVLATAWNILGGYCGYVNFGSAAFFAIGAYTTVVMTKLPAFANRHLPPEIASFVGSITPPPIPVLIVLGGSWRDWSDSAPAI